MARRHPLAESRGAEEAAGHIGDVAEARSWFRHIAEAHGVRHVEVIHEQLFVLERRHA